MEIGSILAALSRPTPRTGLVQAPAPAPTEPAPPHTHHCWHRTAGSDGYTGDSADPAPSLARLEAAERAIRSGLGLTTTEVAWILGVRPGSAVVTRGGIQATRTGWNCWRLQSADSGDAGDLARSQPA